MSTCPFCGRDPFHYEHNGLGMEAVAVVCCEPGIELYRRNPPDTVTLGRDDFWEIAETLRKLRAEIEYLRDSVEAIKQATLDGRVCNDIAWFSNIETLHDYCEHVLEYSSDQCALFTGAENG